MKTRMMKLATETAAVIGLAFSAVGSASAAPIIVPSLDMYDAGGPVLAALPRVIQLGAESGGSPRCGYMVGRHFVGFFPK